MLQHCLCAMLWSLDLKACGITVPQPGIELALPISEGEVPTIGPPRKSLSFCLCLSVSVPLGGSLPHWLWAWPDGFLWPMGLNKCNTTKDSKSVCTQEFDLSSISETFLTCSQVHVWGLISHLLEYARYMFIEWTKPSSACMLQDCGSCYFLCTLVSNSHNFFLVLSSFLSSWPEWLFSGFSFWVQIWLMPCLIADTTLQGSFGLILHPTPPWYYSWTPRDQQGLVSQTPSHILGSARSHLVSYSWLTLPETQATRVFIEFVTTLPLCYALVSWLESTRLESTVSCQLPFYMWTPSFFKRTDSVLMKLTLPPPPYPTPALTEVENKLRARKQNLWISLLSSAAGFLISP